jgi:hypothetical protein
MNLTTEQRKWMWIAVAVIVFWYFVRPMIFYAMQMTAYRAQYARMAAVRQQQAKAAAPTPATLGIPLNKLLGIWEGKTAIEGRGNCALKFELRQSPDVRLAGFSTLNCQPLRGNVSADPETAILSGAANKGSFQFRVDKVVGPDRNGCAPMAFTLTPFGVNQLAAEWQEQGCPGGHAILRRTKP